MAPAARMRSRPIRQFNSVLELTASDATWSAGRPRPAHPQIQSQLYTSTKDKHFRISASKLNQTIISAVALRF
jgi:hypothetical protein